MITKHILSSSELHTLISDNSFKVDASRKFISRCIDGRYKKYDNLPALAIPGGDIGDLAVLYATSNLCAFEVVYDKAFSSLQELVGVKNFAWHTDDHAEKDVLGAGCGHLSQLRNDPEAYHLFPDQVDILNKQIEKAKKDGGQEVCLTGKHQESAVVIINGDYGVTPEYTLLIENGQTAVQIFISHQTLVNLRHKAWAKILVEQKIVKLMDNLDEDYLYQVMSETADDHLFETAKRLATDLPIYKVTFDEKGDFKIEDLGAVVSLF